MKKIIWLVLILIFAFTFVGCGENGDTPTPDPTPVDPTPQEEDKKVETVSITNKVTSLTEGESYELNVTVAPDDAKDKELVYESSDTNVLEVVDGVIYANNEGSAKVTVKAKSNPNATDSLTINVTKPFVPTLEVPATLELHIGEEKKVEYSSNINEAAKITSKNEEVVKVNDGNIIGVAKGSAKITVTVGSLSKDITVTVLENTFEISGEASAVAGATVQLKALLNGKEVNATWVSNEPNVATVDNTGLVTTITEGSVVIKATSEFNEEAQVTIMVEANVIKPTSITLKSNAPETIYIDTEIKLDAEILPLNANKDIIWTTSDERTAKVDKNGNVRFYKGGSVVITATSKLKKGINASITLTSLDYVDPMEFFVKYNVGEVAQQWCENACWDRDPYPWTLLRGSISYYWFEDYVVVTSTAYDASPGEYSFDKRANTWYITVHDAGGVSTGQSLANYAKGSARNEEKSWHYSVGSDGIFKGLDEDYGGWHAGDGSRSVEWTDTKVEADPFNPHATVSISSDQYWIVNGVKTDIKVRPTNAGGSGVPTRFTDSDLPMTGINTRIGSNGTYLISNVWWSSSYRTLSNCGGNMNSIGMESEVGDNAELEVTWHHIAQLCADIIVRRNLALGLDAICQHNTFSGKNCPQTMREAGRWGYFKKMAEAEYYARKYLQDFKFELICSSPLIDSRGQVISFPAEATEITYQVRVTSTAYNYDKTTDPIKVVIPAAIPKTK